MADGQFKALPRNDERVVMLLERYGPMLIPDELAMILRWDNLHSLQTMIARARKQPRENVTDDFRVILSAEHRFGRRLRYESAVLARLLAPFEPASRK